MSDGEGKAAQRPRSEPKASEGGLPRGKAAQKGAEQRCDFCGKAVPTVRRVALDRGYDRLGPRHGVRYACPPCSEAKDRERRAQPAG